MVKTLFLAACLLAASALPSAAAGWVKCNDIVDRLAGKQLCSFVRIPPIYQGSFWDGKWANKLPHCIEENRLAFCATSIKQWRPLQ